VQIDNIETEDYSIRYDENQNTINWKGLLRLNGTEEYAPIMQMLEDIMEKEPSALTLNLRELEFLNSSGINLLSKFVIKVRQKKTIQMTMQGSQNIPWQEKSLKNLKRLMPSLEMEWE